MQWNGLIAAADVRDKYVLNFAGQVQSGVYNRVYNLERAGIDLQEILVALIF